MHWQIYLNGLNYEFLKLKFVLINKGESNRKFPKMFGDKDLQMTHKKLHTLIYYKKSLTTGFKKQMCARPLNTKSFYHGLKVCFLNFSYQFVFLSFTLLFIADYNHGGLNKKEIQLNLFNILSIFKLNEVYLFA